MSDKEQLLDNIRNQISSANKVLIYFDDDVDGLSSYNLIKRLCKKEKGVIIKSTPVLREQYLSVYESYEPDLVIILDKPMIEPAFIDKITVPLIWIDHHDSQSQFVGNRRNVTYYNPHNFVAEDNSCTAYCAYQITKENEWLCVLGSVADWQLNDVTKKFAEKNPTLLNPKFTNPADALFNSKIGEYVKLLTFNLKGDQSDVKKSIYAFARINSFEELIDLKTDDASFLQERYNVVGSEYAGLIKSAKEVGEKAKKLIVFEYAPTLVSVTSELSNELLYTFPKKIILIARLKNDEYKCSLRCGDGYHLPTLVQKSMAGLRGYGGGHDHACGACVHKDDFKTFLSRFEKLVE